jgi:hypothetical protein
MLMNSNHKTGSPRSVSASFIRNCLPIVAVSVFLLSACATTGSGEGAVATRSEARWNAIIAGDFNTAYQYYTPGYRSSHTPGDFEISMRLRKVQVREVKYLDKNCDDSACTVKLQVQYHIASPVPGLDTWESNTTLEEKWIKTQGQWWYFPDK